MSSDTPVQPKIADLMADYLRRRAEAQTAGLAGPDSDAEVTGYDAGPVRPIDAKPAWSETLAVAKCYGCDSEMQSLVPAGWPRLVAGLEPMVALACALGNFPQMVRNFHDILQSRQLAQFRPSSARSLAFRETASGDLLDWADTTAKGNAFPQLLLVAGVLRLARQFEHAEKVLHRRDARVPAQWRSAWHNEKAALAWHRGETSEANELWQRMEISPAVLFNRGMSELFLERPEKAKEPFTQAVAELPVTGAWHHLGQLYLTLIGG